MIVLLPNPSGLASLLAILIDGKDISIYILVLSSSIDHAICVSAPVLNNMPYLISDLFLFK